MFYGTTVNIGGTDYVVPPISLGQLRNGALTLLKEHDDLVAAGDTFAAIEIRGKIIFKALQRNYPDFDETKLLDHLDMANVGPIWLSVLGASGFVPGETEAVTLMASGISSPSTEASPLPTDGPSSK